MPKPMVMTVHVEEVALGKIFRMLDGAPGVVNIMMHGSGPKQKQEKKRKNGNGLTTIPNLILGALVENGTSMHREAMIPILEEAGKAGASLPDALTTLAKLGDVRRNKGIITITAKGKKRFAAAKEARS